MREDKVKNNITLKGTQQLSRITAKTTKQQTNAMKPLRRRYKGSAKNENQKENSNERKFK